MISYIWTGLIVISCVTACCLGRIGELSAAVTDGAGDAVTLCLTMVGMMGLWSGIMELMEQGGITRAIAAVLRPVLSRLFPHAEECGALGAISACVTANLLGMSNAATPFGLKAAEELSHRGDARNDLLRLILLNTTSIQLIPATVAAVRAANGAKNPFDILPAVWGASVCSVAVGLLVSYILQSLISRGTDRGVSACRG